MTENKRFTLSYTYGILDNGEQMEDLSNVCECLNALHEENEQLKIQRKNTTKEFQKLLDFIRSKGLTLTEYEEFKNRVMCE